MNRERTVASYNRNAKTFPPTVISAVWIPPKENDTSAAVIRDVLTNVDGWMCGYVVIATRSCLI